MQTKKEIEIIFFDYDGTIAKTIPGIVNAVNAMLTHMGLPQRKSDEIISFIGQGQQYLIELSAGTDKQDVLSNALAYFDDYYSKHLDDGLVLYPGVKDGLAYLQNKINIIISNKNTAYIKTGLEILGVYTCFKDIAGGDTGTQRKPSPESLNILLKKYGIAPHNALMVGDMDIDIQTGKNAGIATCGVTYGLGSRESLKKAGADYIIDSLAELKNIIK